jgi:hypothetical protein
VFLEIFEANSTIRLYSDILKFKLVAYRVESEIISFEDLECPDSSIGRLCKLSVAEHIYIYVLPPAQMNTKIKFFTVIYSVKATRWKSFDCNRPILRCNALWGHGNTQYLHTNCSLRAFKASPKPRTYIKKHGMLVGRGIFAKCVVRMQAIWNFQIDAAYSAVPTISGRREDVAPLLSPHTFEHPVLSFRMAPSR